MKESYESLEMEVIAFDRDIWTSVAPDSVAGSGGNTSTNGQSALVQD